MVPFKHVVQSVHPTDAAAFCAWYLPSVQPTQAESVLVNENPLGQYKQTVPVNSFEVWYIPMEHTVQLVDADVKKKPTVQYLQVAPAYPLLFWY